MPHLRNTDQPLPYSAHIIRTSVRWLPTATGPRTSVRGPTCPAKSCGSMLLHSVLMSCFRRSRAARKVGVRTDSIASRSCRRGAFSAKMENRRHPQGGDANRVSASIRSILIPSRGNAASNHTSTCQTIASTQDHQHCYIRSRLRLGAVLEERSRTTASLCRSPGHADGPIPYEPARRSISSNQRAVVPKALNII
jgi:hypothetical protein